MTVNGSSSIELTRENGGNTPPFFLGNPSLKNQEPKIKSQKLVCKFPVVNERAEPLKIFFAHQEPKIQSQKSGGTVTDSKSRAKSRAKNHLTPNPLQIYTFEKPSSRAASDD